MYPPRHTASPAKSRAYFYQKVLAVHGLPNTKASRNHNAALIGATRAHLLDLLHSHLRNRPPEQFALQEGYATFLEAIADKYRLEDPLLFMWGIWTENGPTSLSRHTVRTTSNPGHRGYYSENLGSWLYLDLGDDECACGLCGSVHSQKDDFSRLFPGWSRTRIRAYEQKARSWLFRGPQDCLGDSRSEQKIKNELWLWLYPFTRQCGEPGCAFSQRIHSTRSENMAVGSVPEIENFVRDFRDGSGPSVHAVYNRSRRSSPLKPQTTGPGHDRHSQRKELVRPDPCTQPIY